MLGRPGPKRVTTTRRAIAPLQAAVHTRTISIPPVLSPSFDSVRSPSPSNAPSTPPKERLKSLQQKGKKDAEGNISVVVRCRGRSAPEVRENAPVVAVAATTRGTTVTLTNPSAANTTSSSSSSSSAPVLPLPATKTYDFGERIEEGRPPLGNVFGSDADQGMIYNDVAKPILQQVLQGYNCTIFAYGQTGTGKTYTMEGDLSPYHGTFAPSAGIIPRTLYALFDKLAEDRAEFSVRVSFVELYNEELRDLNALDFSEPYTSGQPMDNRAGSSTANTTGPGSNGGGGLRIYDDKAAGTGVVIQGLEETLISCAEDGLKVLKRGSERRQIGATKCNEQSSRSHSIFTIVVHIKETSKSGGEDLLKVGKLNLVDLAGSENVGRSGAEKGRAREAGMINASLLALGRVINKLVEKQSHIPYRESKLTRLLQDSLGGRTKTTIIATISPVNFEETISTLDYAARAKRIENRPEINQRMTKTVLLGQYATEIERLKADLVAAREKNGIFFSSASWAELKEEQDARRIQLDEAKRQVEINESLLETTRAQFEQNLRLLGTREDELKRITVEMRRKSDDLVALARELVVTKVELSGEAALRDAFEESRKGWKGAAGDAFKDADGLFAKLDRKSRVETSNHAVIDTASSAFLGVSGELAQEMAAFRGTQQDFSIQLKRRLVDFAEQQAGELTSSFNGIDQRLVELESAAASLLEANGSANAHDQTFLALVEKGRGELLASVEQHSARATAQHAEQGNKILADLEDHSSKTFAALELLAAPMAALQEESRSWRARDAERLRLIQEEDRAALVEENARLQALVQHLTVSLEQQREDAVKDDEEVLALLTASLKARSSKFVSNLDSSYTSVRSGLESVSLAHSARQTARGQQLGNLEQSNVAAGVQLDRRAKEVEKAGAEGRVLVEKSLQSVHEGVGAYRLATDTSSRDHVALVLESAELVGSGAATFRTDASTSHARLDEELGSLATSTREGYAACRENLQHTRDEIEVTSSALRDTLDAHSLDATTFLDTSKLYLDDLRQDVRSYLGSEIQRDVPTGSTPRKREWPRDALLPAVDLDADREAVVRSLRRASGVVRTPEGELKATLERVVEEVSPSLSPVLLPTVLPLQMLKASTGPPVTRVLSEQDVNMKRRSGLLEVGGKRVVGQLRS